MEITQQLKNQHLLWRAGFGVSAADLADLDHIAPHKWYRRLEKASATAPSPIDTISASVKNMLQEGSEDLSQMKAEERKAYNANRRRQLNKQSNLDIRDMTLAWMEEMISGAQLREKMALFWHGHFACRVNNSLYQQQLLHIIRTHALASFGELLRAVSKSASMLAFLNNQQNRKRKPNENFAREVMELFTMGRGHYTEQDIKESARAFTGWGFRRDGSFVFREGVHDTGEKQVLGRRGRFGGDEVLSIILEQKQTARHLCSKLYRFLVNEEINEEQVNWLADRYYNSNYDTGKLLRDIFTSDWFYEEQHIGNRIKSPVEYLVGIQRVLPMQLRNGQVRILLQRLLGQWLFNPPNVAGWPGGTAWIDSSSLMLRLRIPGLISNEESLHIKPKGNDDVEMGQKEVLATGGRKPKKPGAGYRIIASVNWPVLEKALGRYPAEELYAVLERLLLQTPPGAVPVQALAPLLSGSGDTDRLQALVIALMSTPEYQLC